MARRRVISRSLAAVGLALLAQVASAAPLCRWVDESGRTQLSDVVPEKYKKVASCTDSQKYELSAEQREQARQRAADEKARAREAVVDAPKAGASAPVRPAAAASRPAAKRPAETVTDATDCATRWRLFDESEECFGPYRTVGGGVKPEAFDACNVVESPDLTCGPRRY